MAVVLKDRVRETTLSTGTGAVTLAGAVTGYQSFAVVGDGGQTYYTIADAVNWEVGLGTYNSVGPTLTRNSVLASSNGGALVNFDVGSKDVWLDYPAAAAAAAGNQLDPFVASIVLGGSGAVSATDLIGPLNNAKLTGSTDILGNVRQNVVTVDASTINCLLGNFFVKTATDALTWTFTNVPVNRSFSFLLELTNGGTGTQTWPASARWPGGTAPTLTASGVDILGFITDDGGANWRGVMLQKDSK